MKERVTFRLGSLLAPLATACKQSGRTPSEEIRVRLAESLGVDAPVMPVGNPDAANARAKGAARKSPRK